MKSFGARLYHLLFGERTILFEGYVSFVGAALYGIGWWWGQPVLARVGTWLVWPFFITVCCALLIICPWIWLRQRFFSPPDG